MFFNPVKSSFADKNIPGENSQMTFIVNTSHFPIFF